MFIEKHIEGKHTTPVVVEPSTMPPSSISIKPFRGFNIDNKLATNIHPFRCCITSFKHNTKLHSGIFEQQQTTLKEKTELFPSMEPIRFSDSIINR